MLPASIALAVAVLLGTVVAGVITHELSHALALRAAGVSCTVGFPGTGSDPRGFRTSVQAPLATVTPTRVPDDLSPWALRVAAMAPLCLAIPFGLVPLGVAPDPFATGDALLQLAAVAWLGCAIPSPRDFSLLWYPERALSDADAGTSRRE